MAAFYADENFPSPTVEALRRFGHDVLTTHEAGQANQRIRDVAVLEFATESGRAVLTLNRRDFVSLHARSPGPRRDRRMFAGCRLRPAGSRHRRSCARASCAPGCAVAGEPAGVVGWALVGPAEVAARVVRAIEACSDVDRLHEWGLQASRLSDAEFLKLVTEQGRTRARSSGRGRTPRPSRKAKGSR